jgi:hypothetical protein
MFDQNEIIFPAAINPNFHDRCHDYAKWFRNNRAIYRAFEAAAAQLITAGRTTYGARSILEKIRFDSSLREHGGDFKINNNLCGLLSRHFQVANPHHGGFFKERSMLGEPDDPSVSAAILKNALGIV